MVLFLASPQKRNNAIFHEPQLSIFKRYVAGESPIPKPLGRSITDIHLRFWEFQIPSNVANVPNNASAYHHVNRPTPTIDVNGGITFWP